MKYVATLKYISGKNCIGIISSSLLKNSQNSNRLHSFCISAGDSVAYLSVTPSSAKDLGTNWFCLNGIYASKLGFTDGCGVLLEPVEPLGCARAWLEPVSVDDWEILELHAGRIEMQALDQIRLLWPGQIFPIWINNNICIFLKTMKVEPSAECSLLMPLTELIVAPKTNQSPSQMRKLAKKVNTQSKIKHSQSKDVNNSSTEIVSSERSNIIQTSRTILYFLFVTCFKKFLLIIKYLLALLWKYVPLNLYRYGTLMFPVLKYQKAGGLLEPSESWFDDHINELPNDFSMISRVEPVLFEQMNLEKLSLSLLNQPNTIFLHSTASLDNCQPDVYLVLLSKYFSPSEKLSESRMKKTKYPENKSDNSNAESISSLSKCVVRMYLHPHTKHAMVSNWKMVCASHRLKVPSCVRRQMNLTVSSKVCLQKLTCIPEACTNVKAIALEVSYEKKYLTSFSSQLIAESFKDWIAGISDVSNPVPISIGVLFVFSLILEESYSLESQSNEILIEALVTDIQTKRTKSTESKTETNITYLLSCNDLAHIDLKFSETKPNNRLPSRTEVDLKLPTETLLVYSNGLEKEVQSLDRFIELALSSRPLSSALSGGGFLLRQTCTLITGAKGTGKSVLCRSMLNKFASDSTMHAFVHSVSCGQWRGKKPESVKRLCDDLLNELLWRQPSILLMEDLDQLIPASFQDEEDATPDSFYTLQLVSVVKSFFQTLAGRYPEGWNPTPRVALLVTAKSKTSMHASMTASGLHLFSNTIHIDFPTRRKREILLRALIQNCTNFDCPADVDKVIEKTEGFAAGDLLKLIQRANHLVQQKKLSRINNEQNLSNDLLDSDLLISALNGFTPASLQSARLHKPLPLSWNEVGGLRTVKQKLQEQLLWPVKYRHLFTDCGLQPQSGILLFGPPGCGKTLIASIVASECGLNFISIKGPELLSKYIGASEAAVRDLFSRACAASPCILFFDEFDSLAPKRGHDSTGVTDRVVNQLLTHLDGVEPLVGVTVMAATSRPDLLDPALLRPGRLDNLLYCAFPDQNERKEILISLSKKLLLDGNIDLVELAEVSNNFSGADLKALLYNAQLEAVHETVGQGRYSRTFDQKNPNAICNSASAVSSMALDLELDDLYQSNGYSFETDDEGELISPRSVNALKATASQLIKTLQDDPSLTNTSKSKPDCQYGYQGCFDDTVCSSSLELETSSPNITERNSDIVYFSTLHHGRSDIVPPGVRQATNSFFNQPQILPSSFSTTKFSSEKLLISNRHIEKALKLTRPSVTVDERRKLELMYSNFVRSRERSDASKKNYYNDNLRTTLS